MHTTIAHLLTGSTKYHKIGRSTIIGIMEKCQIFQLVDNESTPNPKTYQNLELAKGIHITLGDSHNISNIIIHLAPHSGSRKFETLTEDDIEGRL